ncbi:MAG: hypothetical protein WAO98_05325 [Alphaproteobacteria bacterium]
MSALELFKSVGIIYAIAYLLSALAAHAEEPPHLATIADCPAGYVLGVQETAEAQLMVKTNPSETQPDSSSQVKEADEAPRRFVTGCVLKQPQR